MKKQILTMGLAAVASVASAASPAFTTAAELVDSLMRCLFHDGEPGAAVVVAKNDDVIVDSGYGVADIVTGDRIDGNTMFNIASISKQFTVAGVLSLADRGLLRADNAVADFLPYESGQWRKIRLSHLMSHSSGVIDARPRTDRQWMLHATDKESVAYMDTLRQFRFEPGEAYEYINPTFQVLECVIEKVSGLAFDDYQQRNVFDRAGLRHTTYFEPQKRIPRMAHAYQTGAGGGEQDFAGKEVYLGRTVVEGSPWKECDYGEETFFATKADGGIYSSTHEMLQWMRALERGEVISQEALALAYAPHTKVSGSPWSDYQNRPNTWYGYGFFIDRTPREPEKIYHTGDNGGFQNYAASFPSCGVKVIVFANRNDFDRWTLVRQIDRILREEGVLE